MTRGIVGRLPADWRYAVSTRLLDSRLTAQAYQRLRPGYHELRITEHTELVIDGFPRSANTYAWLAMRHVSADGLNLAGHTHGAATVLRAAHMNLPCIVLIRSPDDAAASMAQMPTSPSLRAALGAYTRFYSKVAQVLDRVVVATFEETIHDFGDVIRRCNASFGTKFPIYHPTPESEAAISAAIEVANRRYGTGELDESTVSRPSPLRRSASDILASADGATLRGLAEAHETYLTIVKCARS